MVGVGARVGGLAAGVEGVGVVAHFSGVMGVGERKGGEEGLMVCCVGLGFWELFWIRGIWVDGFGSLGMWHGE